MKYLKLFEEIDIKQQPFFLSKGDRLYVSDDFAKYMARDVPEHLKDRRDDFFGGVRKTYHMKNGKTWTSFKERMTNTNIKVAWSKGGLRDTYAMSIYIYRRGDDYLKNESGKFKYYIGGTSGDSEMHGKNMIRGTRQCNINVIKKFFPIFEYIPYAHKKLQENTFFDVIKNAVEEKPELAKYLTEGDYPKDYQDFLIQQQTELYNL